jgi:hypothetical protein
MRTYGNVEDRKKRKEWHNKKNEMKERTRISIPRHKVSHNLTRAIISLATERSVYVKNHNSAYSFEGHLYIYYYNKFN